MSFHSYLDHWAGLPVVAFEPGSDEAPDFSGTIYRIAYAPPLRRGLIRRKTVRAEYSWSDALDKFLAFPGSDQVRALVVGHVGHQQVVPVVQTLLEIKDRLPRLERLFVGDVLSEECEVSWLWMDQEGSMRFGPVLEAYPGLKEFRVRGSIEAVGPVRHICLEKLVIESGNTSREIFAQLLASVLPELGHLEVYLGDEDYGGDTRLEDVLPLMDGVTFPKLKHLGLRNSAFTDEISVALADSVVLDQIESLDLSLGTLGDRGAEALLASEKVRRLRAINLSHHFMSDAMAERWRTSGLPADLSDQLVEEDGQRYVSVSE